MQSFDYLRPRDPAAAQAAVAARPGARYVAGGTNLLDLMKVGIAQPPVLVDLRSVTPQGVARMANGSLRLGAGTTNTQVASDAQVREHAPLLARALLSGASAQIRNRATVAGNLLQRTRCAYFYNLDAPCNKRSPGAGCAARDGMNRMHALFGGSTDCVATHPSDMAVGLAALDAQVDVRRAGGQRDLIPITDLYVLPGTTPHVDSVLAPGDLITGVSVPASTTPVQIYRKVRDRASFAFALVSVAAAVSFSGGRVSAVRLAFGGVAPRPWRQPQAEQRLLGTWLTPKDIDAAAHEAVQGAAPLTHNAFKVALLQQTVRQVLTQAATQIEERT